MPLVIKLIDSCCDGLLLLLVTVIPKDPLDFILYPNNSALCIILFKLTIEVIFDGVTV